MRAKLRCRAFENRVLLSAYFVATTGNDTNNGLSLTTPFKTIQHALNVAANPGDSIAVEAGTYHERLTFPHSGSAAGGSIALTPYNGGHVILTGSGAPSNDVGYGNNMVQIINQSYVTLSGFEIEYNSGVSISDDAFGVRVQGSGTNIEISHNIIHNITGSVSAGVGGMGIHVYGSSVNTPMSNVIIDSNTIYACQPGDAASETLTVNGNVTNFQITNNIIHDDNNIGIDMIGGEGDVFGLSNGTQGLPVARNGVCSHNIVYRTHANYGGGYAGGIYVDGGQDITISDNVSYQNDYGLEVGAENHGYIASGIVVENNVLYNNRQGGLVFGGYQYSVGRVENCTFINNTIVNCDTTRTGDGQLDIGFASNNIVANNIFVASSNNVLIGAEAGPVTVNHVKIYPNVNNTLDGNLFYAAGGAARAEFYWNNTNTPLISFQTYRSTTGEDPNSIFAKPIFVNITAGNFHEAAGSPSIDAGSATSGWSAATDFDGITRDSPPDIGAFEYEQAGQARPMHGGSANVAPASSAASWATIDDIFAAYADHRWLDGP